MAGINTYLREFRLEKGLTQEDVANRVGLTRQAISSYESGKRQPGIDILLALAKVYEVPIDTLLYGNKTIKDKRTVCSISIIFAFIFFVLQIISGVLSILSFAIYPIDQGMILNNQMEFVEKHFDLLTMSHTIEKIAAILILLGSIIAMGFDLIKKVSLSWKKKIFFYLITLGITWLIAIILAIVHPTYTIFNYIYTGPIYFMDVAVILLIDIIISFIKNKKAYS